MGNYRFRIFILLAFACLALTSKCFAAEVVYAKTEDKSFVTDALKTKAEPEPEIELKNPFVKMQKQTPEPPKKEVSQLDIDSDTMEYLSDTNEVEAKGNVKVSTLQDSSTITADRAVLNRDTNLLKFYDNVVLKRGDAEIEGDYMVVDLNEENILLNEPTGRFMTFKITAREGHAYANKLEAINGELELAQKMEIKLASYGFGMVYDDTIIDEKLVSYEMRKKRSEPLRIETKEIYIKSNKDHDNITFKDASVYYKKFKLATASNVEIHTDKNQSYVETNIPEIGSISDFGTFIGLGYVQELPRGATIKLIPALVFSDGAGIGAIARVRSKRNMIEGAWATSSENLIVRGKYKFNDNLRAEYSRHGYMDEWFMGARRPGYLAQLVHHKSWNNDDLGATFTQRLTGGYVAEYSKENQEEQNGTMRLRWQSELRKDILSVGGKEQDVFFNVAATAQAAATVYGTGETTGLIRFGPQIHSRIKNWGSRIFFAMSGIHGLSPYRFDEYRYGRASISIDENLRLGKYLAIGYAGTFSPLKDNPEDNLLTENRFYVMAGPEDIKLAVSHDTVREITSFDVLFLFGSDNLKTKFQKITVQDPTSLGKERKFLDDLQFYKIKVPQEGI